MKRKVNLLLLAFLPVLASLGIQLAAAFLVSFWFSVVSIIRLILEGITDPEVLATGMANMLLDPLFNDILMSVTYVALVVVFLIWYRKQKDQSPSVAFDEVFCIRNTIIILVSGLATQIAISMCLNLILPLFPQTLERYTSLLESLVGGSIIVSVITTAVLAPIAEELIFRELMTKQLRQLFPFWLANIIQALVFGIYHLNIVQGIYAFFFGLLCGYVAYRMRSIWASIMLHGIVNASGLVLDIILPGALFESTVGMIIFAILCSTITVLLTLLYRFPTNGKPSDNTIPVSDFPIPSVESPIPYTNSDSVDILSSAEDSLSSPETLKSAENPSSNNSPDFINTDSCNRKEEHNSI